MDQVSKNPGKSYRMSWERFEVAAVLSSLHLKTLTWKEKQSRSPLAFAFDTVLALRSSPWSPGALQEDGGGEGHAWQVSHFRDSFDGLVEFFSCFSWEILNLSHVCKMPQLSGGGERANFQKCLPVLCIWLCSV